MKAPLAAAISRGDVADYIDRLVLVYVVLIFLLILSSFLPQIPYNRYFSMVLGFIGNVVNPYLRFFRKILPQVRIGPAAMDLSPIVGTIVLLLVGGIVSSLIRGS